MLPDWVMRRGPGFRHRDTRARAGRIPDIRVRNPAAACQTEGICNGRTLWPRAVAPWRRPGRSAARRQEMTQRIIRRAAVAAALVATLALAAPAQAANTRRGIPETGWFELAWQWAAGLWPGGVPGRPAGAGQPAPKTEKTLGLGSDSSTAPP